MAAKRDAAAELAEVMARALEIMRGLGADSYPTTLRRLVDPAAAGALIGRAVKRKAFSGRAVVIRPSDPDSPVALAEDAALLADSPAVLTYAMDRCRTPTQPACTVAKLKTKLPLKLRKPFEESVRRRIEARTLPPEVGCLRDKRSYLLFSLSDVIATEGVRPEPARDGPSTPPAMDFGEAFDNTFRHLDGRAGSHNAVSLVDLRRALPFERAAFDAGLRDLRRAGRYTLSAAEGRHGIAPEEREAGVVEDGTLLLYVSRKLA